MTEKSHFPHPHWQRYATCYFAPDGIIQQLFLEKSASVCTLKGTIYSLIIIHSVADVISSASNELPLDTWTVFQEVQPVAKSIIDCLLSIANLEPLNFLTSSGKVVKIDDVSDLKNRPDDIAFFRF